MMSQSFLCLKCKKGYNTRRALTQHQRKSVVCQVNIGPKLGLNVVRRSDVIASNTLAFSQLNVADGVAAAPSNTSNRLKLPPVYPLSDKTNTAKLHKIMASLKEHTGQADNEDAHFGTDHLDDEDSDSSVTTLNLGSVMTGLITNTVAVSLHRLPKNSSKL
jgi:hypothetical protein